MKKNQSKPLLLAALTGLFLLAPVRNAYIPETIEAAQVSASHDSKLSAFDIAPGTLSPAFSPDITEYTSTVNADVTSVSVQAVPRASGAVIASVEGRDGLQPGVNTIKVTCSAQDNTFTVYTITLTVGSADAGAQQPADTQPDTGSTEPVQPEDAGSADNTSQPDAGDAAGTSQSDADGTGDTQQPDNGSTPDTQPDAGAAADAQSKKKRSLAKRLSGTIKADGTVKLSGAAYKLSSNFTYGSTTQDIPSAFGQGSVQIGDTNYPTLYCQSNGVNLVYMENTDGNGSTGFYFYDEIKNVVERFKYIGNGDNFVIFISNAREEVPSGYTEKALKLPSDKKVAAYQSEYSDELKDYYLVYGINSNGTSGWYFYDKSQGTYLRYSNAFAAQGPGDEDSGEEEVERTVSLTKYNSLNEKYTELKENRVKIVSILIVVMIVLIIIFTALLLRSREDDDEEEETDSRVRGSKKKKPKKSEKQSETISKSSLAAGRNFEGNVSKRSKKVTKTFTQEPAQEPQRKSAVRDDHISTPEEIRAQVSSGQTMYGQESRTPRAAQSRTNSQQPGMEPRTNGQWSDMGDDMNGQRGYASSAPQREQFSKGSSSSSPDTVQMAAERMRQSVKYPRRAPKAEVQEPVHDPMDDWDMDDTASRKAHKAGKASRKRRSRMEDDMEIMDLNDL